MKNKELEKIHQEILECEQLLIQLGEIFETIGGYFDMGNYEEARKHFEVAYNLQGAFVKNKFYKKFARKPPRFSGWMNGVHAKRPCILQKNMI